MVTPAVHVRIQSVSMPVLVAGMEKEFKKRLRTCGEILRSRIVLSLNVPYKKVNRGPDEFSYKTGKIRRGKVTSVDIGASKPGESPRWRTRQLRNTITYRVDAAGVSVGTPLDYGLYLELGTVHMAARPYLRPAFNAERGRMVTVLSAPLPPPKLSLH